MILIIIKLKILFILQQFFKLSKEIKSNQLQFGQMI